MELDPPEKQAFPIVEAFGHAADAGTPESLEATHRRWCPFMGTACEKFQQYGFGYCSVQYATEWDAGIRQIYAVCDHRLDGPPVQAAVQDYFGGSSDARLVPEVVLKSPRTSFDYVAYQAQGKEITDVVAIESQAIDLRGGGVGPAWRAWMDGRPEMWRRYFTEEAQQKGRRDNVAYGVNMANIYKRLGLQVSEKGAFLKRIGVKLYIVMQDRPFQYLRNRIRFQEQQAPWDITFLTFDYTGRRTPAGQLEFQQVQLIRTSLENYNSALAAGRIVDEDEREAFLRCVKRKAGLLP